MDLIKRVGRVAPIVVTAFAALVWIGCSDAASIPEIGLVPGDSSEAAIRSNRGLVAAYGFDEPTGSIVSDASGASNEGTFRQGVTRTTSGKFGGALAFDGTGRVTIPSSTSLNLSESVTVAAWVNPTSATAVWRDIVYKGDDAYYLMATSSRGPRPAAGLRLSKTPQTQVFASATLPTNTWTHLAMTYDGSAIRLYVNGEQVSGAWGSGTIKSTTNPLEIGGDGVYGQYFQGQIDEVRVYNRPLGSIEIRMDMERPIVSSVTPSGSAACTNEPAGYTVINEQPFDVAPTSLNDLTHSSGWLDDHRNAAQLLTVVNDPTSLYPSSNHNVIQGLFKGGFSGGNAPWFVWTQFTKQFRNIYMCMYVQHSANWDNTAQGVNGGTKFVWPAADQVQGTLNFAEWEGSQMEFGFMQQGPVDRKMGANVNSSAADVANRRGKWVKYEWVLMASSSNSAKDGGLDIWIDGVQTHHYTDVQWQMNSNRTWLSLAWNPTYGWGFGNVPNDQYENIDHIRITGSNTP